MSDFYVSIFSLICNRRKGNVALFHNFPQMPVFQCQRYCQPCQQIWLPPCLSVFTIPQAVDLDVAPIHHSPKNALTCEEK